MAIFKTLAASTRPMKTKTKALIFFHQQGSQHLFWVGPTHPYGHMYLGTVSLWKIAIKIIHRRGGIFCSLEAVPAVVSSWHVLCLLRLQKYIAFSSYLNLVQRAPYIPDPHVCLNSSLREARREQRCQEFGGRVYKNLRVHDQDLPMPSLPPLHDSLSTSGSRVGWGWAGKMESNQRQWFLITDVSQSF